MEKLNKRYIRNCEICNGYFSTNVPNKKFCSEACLKEHKNRISTARYRKNKQKIYE